MKRILTVSAFLAGIATSAVAQPSAAPLSLSAKDLRDVFLITASLSCSPRKTCSKTVDSCDEAYWLMENCSWGDKLDGDGDGVPCENMCSGA